MICSCKKRCYSPFYNICRPGKPDLVVQSCRRALLAAEESFMPRRGQHLLGLGSVLLCAAAASFHGVCRAVDALPHILGCALHAGPLRPCSTLCGLHRILQACTHVVIALTPCHDSHSPAAHCTATVECRGRCFGPAAPCSASIRTAPQIFQSCSPVLCEDYIVLLSSGACCKTVAHGKVTGRSSKGGTHCRLHHPHCRVLTAPCQQQRPSGSQSRSAPDRPRT